MKLNNHLSNTLTEEEVHQGEAEHYMKLLGLQDISEFKSISEDSQKIVDLIFQSCKKNQLNFDEVFVVLFHTLGVNLNDANFEQSLNGLHLHGEFDLLPMMICR